MDLYPVDAPIVIVHNYLEAFRKFLSRPGDDRALMSRRFNGDQALFWLGTKKLIISSAPIENVDLLSQRWGYLDVSSISPDEPSAQLCMDIIRDERLISAIEGFAGEQKAVMLVSYAVSAEFYELAKFLETDCGIRVHLPEAPARDKLWLKHYIDSKVGFRDLVQRWGGGAYLPEGYMASDLATVAEIAQDFARSGRGVAIKANIGGSGVGNKFLTLDEIMEFDFEKGMTDEGSQFSDPVYVVEEFIQSTGQLSPSLEFYVPESGKGDPVLTYLCNQHFEDSGRFAGVIIAEELYHAPWYPDFRKIGLEIAAELQRMGYVGHFDLDSIVSDDGHLFLVEINSRRTGGTYVHEFLTNQFGVDYTRDYAVLSQNKVETRYKKLESLETEIGDLLFSPIQRNSGVIILLTSEISKGKFGYTVVGKTIEEVLSIRKKLVAKL